MKRFGITTAITALFLAGSFTSIASTTTLEKMDTEPLEMTLQDEFTEVTVDDVPQAVKDGVAKAYQGAEIDKAYVNTVKIYKLEISDDVKSNTVYFDESGKELEL